MTCRRFIISAFLFLILGTAFEFVYSSGSVIWSRAKNDFIPIEDVAEFRALQQYHMEKIRSLEKYNFNNATLTIAVFEMPNIAYLTSNGTKITGILGEIWNTLAEHLNFTIIPVKVSTIGVRLPNGSYDGAIGMLMRNEIQVIAANAHNPELNDIMYMMRIWKTSVYTRSTRKFTRPQISHIFSPIVWYLVLFFYVFLSLIGYLMQRTSIRVSRERKFYHHFYDHLFYTLSVFCSQGFIPDSFYRHTKIISFVKAMLSIFILITVSSQFVSDTSMQKSKPVFQDLAEMFTDTNYSIIVNTQLPAFTALKEEFKDFFENEKYSNRIIDIGPISERYKRVCKQKKKFSLFIADHIQQAYGRSQCKLISTPKSYFPTWIGSNLLNSFKFKKAIDIGLLKMMESGLIDRLKKRWMPPVMMDDHLTVVQPVRMEQVLVPFMILGVGMIASIIIFIIEHIVYNYNYNRR